ncbi:putative 2-dehydropantoate 2-reductase [Rosellinia necatrix]|uniref:Putative 2-dehydropantoate 2-reductase n=1 Tax=Rosellinia necatrix TaxID=77044 RepID=A0A1W2TLV9_ROSNE|nr:putative 2-dehydropantoate 2-reductase [Rosellinia necatrix]
MGQVKNPPESSAAWLRRLIEDDTKPPKLYAWTLENLAARSGVGSETIKDPHVGRTNGRHGDRDDGRDDDDDGRRRIHILGVGNIGRLYAMCLSKLADRPPITLVVHRRDLLERWAAEPGIELTRRGRAHRRADFDIEWWTDVPPPCGGHAAAEVAAGRVIHNLIVATKAPDAMPEVDRIRRYLGAASAVAFAQNGMCRLWPPLGDAYVRARFPGGAGPAWVACVTTHGVASEGPFRSVHTAPATVLVGSVMLGAAEGGRAGGHGEQAKYLMRKIAEAPDLDAREVSRKELWIAQLEKLVVNAIVNPLTAVLRCKNGELLVARDDALPVVIDKLLSEASEILATLILDPKSAEVLISEPVGRGEISEDLVTKSLGTSCEQLLERFSFPRLRNMVLDVGAKVGANTSSMLQDVNAGKPTEIDDFNGWLVDTANLLGKGLRLPTHEKLIALVKAQAALTRSELCAELLGEKDC